MNLNLPSSKKINKFFLSKDATLNSDEKVDLILSPEFYWCRSFDIPVTRVSAALKFLPTLFEEIVTKGTYNYFCIKKSDSSYLCFAYESQVVIEHIKNSGLSLNQIRHIYFAQTQMEDFSEFCIDNKKFVYVNNILTKYPSSFNKNIENISSVFENNNNKHKVDFKFYTHVFDKKYLYLMLIISGIVIGINGLKYMQSQKNITVNEKKIKALKRQYKLPRTQLQLNSILKSFHSQKNSNERFFGALSYVMNIPNIKNKKIINSIEYKEKRLIIDFINLEQKSIEKYIKAVYPKAKISLNKKNINVKISL